MAFSKVSALKSVNLVLGLAILGQLTTAVLFVFFVDTIPFESVRLIHLVLGCILFTGIITHIILNWTWIKTSYFKRKKQSHDK